MQLSSTNTMDSEAWTEPLNLVKKKSKPVAIVAPSSVIDKNYEKRKLVDSYDNNCKGVINYVDTKDSSIFGTETKFNGSENKYDDSMFRNSYTLKREHCSEEAEDLSNHNDSIDNSLKSDDMCKEGMKNYILNSNATRNFQNVEFGNKDEKCIEFSQIGNGSEGTTKNTSDSPSLYSVLQDIAMRDNKFLSALYMNRFMAGSQSHMPTPTIPLAYHAQNYYTGPNYERPVSTMTDTSNLSSTSLLSNFLSFADIRNHFWQIPSNWQEIQKLCAPASPSVASSNFPLEPSSSNCKTPEIPLSPPISSVPKASSKKPRTSSKGSSSMDQKNSTSSTTESSKTQDSGQGSNNQDKKKPHIKKPLNAFMLYMKEMRAKVVAECTLKESAAINQILGRRWHALGREEQAKYYELARRERQLHMQLYPDWSSRANSSRGKKRKRKQETNDGGNSMKKCRARYGLDQQNQWCKPCRRKKKCIRYMESGESADGNQSEDNIGSCGSVGEAQTPPDDGDGDGDGESLAHSLSSPGGLSGLSSLTSPSMILPSPGTSLASPSVSLASPCVSLQSPLTPHEPGGGYDCKPPVTNNLPLPLPLPLPAPASLHHHHLHQVPAGPPAHRNPVGTNPRDANNPLSVNQLTGQCVKSEGAQDSSRPVISVT